MASGKKGKTKWKAVNLTDIVEPSVPRKPATLWADEADEPDSSYSDYNRKPAEKVVLPTAPRAARDIDSDLKIPREPPFQAYISNLAYDVTEEELTAFFDNFKIKNVRLPREERSSRDDRSKIKGFGYVEFEDRSEFVEALGLCDTNLKGRRMKIEVAQDHDSNQGGRGRMRDRGDPDRANTDWRAGPRIDDRERDGYRRNTNRREYGGSGFSRRDEGEGGFSDRNWDQRGSDRGGGFRDRDGDRGGGYRDGDRGGGFRDGYRERDSERSWLKDKDGERDRDRDRGYNRDREDRSDHGSDRSWRREPDRDREPPQDQSSNEPKTRPKLKLQPRTKPPEEVAAAVVKEEVASTPTPPAASIFGGARPVDTAAREREIEERLSKQKDDKFDESSRNKPAAIGAKEREPIPSPAASESSIPPRDGAQSPVNKSIEPAPPPKENAWTRRNQTTPQVNNGRLSPHEDSESNKPSRDELSPVRHSSRDESSGSDSQKKYQPPRRQQDSDQRRPRSREDRGRGSGSPRGGGGERGPQRTSDVKGAAPPSKSRETRKDLDDVSKMPKLQEHRAPNFAGSNKFAFLEDSSEASAD